MYKTARWRAARAAYLAEHPYCVACESEGRRRAATVVDHVVPHRGDPVAFWNETNWQALCAPCHNTKSAREDGWLGNQVRR